jgi:regulator of sigma E protease
MITNILAFLFVLGIVVFVHELGHFLAARRVGVRVLTFSLGFGPKLLKFRRGDTEYAISAIPLGGYVKMAGEQPDDERSGASDEFLSKSKWQRFQVLIAGPLMNVLLAIVVLAGVLYQGADIPIWTESAPVVGYVGEASPAASAGIKEGDRIVRVNAIDVKTWDEFFMAVVTKANREIPITVERDGRQFDVQITPAAVSKYEMGSIGVGPFRRVMVTTVAPGSPAERAGIKSRDVIAAVDGEPVDDRRLVERLKNAGGRQVAVTVLRDGSEQTFQMTPEGEPGKAMIGIGLGEESRTMKPGFFEAIALSAQRNWETAGQILTTLGGLFTRETPVRQLMGPVAIGELSGTAASMGWLALFNFMAMISLNLGLINLMPIPVLDGGHILILGLEGLARRDFSMRVKEKVLIAGFAVILMLMVTVIYNDLTRVEWIERFMFWRQ